MLGTNDDPCNEERSDYVGEKWIADSGASFQMTHSPDLLSDVRLGDDRVRVGDNHLIHVMGYGILTLVFQGDVTVKLLCQTSGCGLRAGHRVFSLLAAHRAGSRI